ncbi:MAG: YerC/YecD family TrpR-related protein [Alphaproteobacteria bacterium]|nr:YerC/YecD family TrpR-related protein [Alphaproteobacteria bacterium]
MTKSRSAPAGRNRFKAVNAKAEADLFETIVGLKNPDECRRFIYDLCTPKEIADIADRWWVARLLDEGKLSYREIHALTGVSVTTVGRVARFLQQENFHGYRLMLDRVKGKSSRK